MDVFVETYRKQWHMDNKPFGFEIMDIRFGYIYSRIKTATLLIKKYLNGEISKIDELEVELLPYRGFTSERQICVPNWEIIVGANNII